MLEKVSWALVSVTHLFVREAIKEGNGHALYGLNDAIHNDVYTFKSRLKRRRVDTEYQVF